MPQQVSDNDEEEENENDVVSLMSVDEDVQSCEADAEMVACGVDLDAEEPASHRAIPLMCLPASMMRLCPGD
jgi:hypothetical protein